jgi:hypothetical protein
VSVGGPERLLDRHGSLDGIDDTRELRQDTIASRVGNPAPMLADQLVHDFPMRREGP